MSNKKKKVRSMLSSVSPAITVIVLILIWQFSTEQFNVPKYILPSFSQVMTAFVNDFSLLMKNAAVTIQEAFIGLIISIISAFLIAVLMDRFNIVYKCAYPLLVITQTIPTVAIAPLLVLWLGYDITPKIVLIIIVCFFPVTVALTDGFGNTDKDALSLMKTMGASYFQTLVLVKIPSGMESFFSGLKIAVSYAFVGAVIAEWLGGESGLGVYMTQVKKSYDFDKMFAVIIFISVISLIAMGLVSIIKNIVMPYKKRQNNKNNF